MASLLYNVVAWGLSGLVLLAILLLIFIPDPYQANASELPDKHDQFKNKAATSVQVLVLGDIGRSPRMQNHAISLARNGARVDLIGFVESDIHDELKKSEMVRVIILPQTPGFFRAKGSIAFSLLAPLKVIWQALSLFYILGYKSRACRWMLVQNPPSIPTLPVAKILCTLRGTKLVVDWHNTGWSILALRLGKDHPLVKLYELTEKIFSREADAHFAVSNAMSKWLKKSFAVDAIPLHDRPTSDFRPLSEKQRSQVLHRLPETASHAAALETGTTKLIVSSTSWTKDEDFSMLLDALVGYSERASDDESMPDILAIITGKGSDKEYYLYEIEQLVKQGKLAQVSILTGWFSLEDYTSLLGAAHLGICLHKSSSGLDLPMKVVDMFGVGLPVVGYSEYASWPELVREGVNGRGFATSSDLENLLVNIFSDNGTLLEILKEGALKERENTWEQAWNRNAGEKLFLPQLIK